jgi:type I restriction enzyme S subunit
VSGDIPEEYTMTELGTLPEKWDIGKLDQVGSLVRGVSYKETDLCEKYQSGFLPVIRAMNIQAGSLDLFYDLVFVKREKISEKQILKVGDIVIAMSSGSKSVVGKAAQLNENWNGSFGAFCAVFRPDSNAIDKEFIGFLFQTITYREYIEKSACGTNIKNLTIPHILNYPIPLPPLPEQHAIAHVLRTVQEAKEKTDAVIAATKALKASMMKHLFTYGPVPLEDAGEVELKETEIGPLPEGWDLQHLGNISKISSGGTPSRTEPSYWNGDIPWIRTGEINYSIIDKTEEKITKSGLENSSSRIVPKGTLLMAMYGEGVTRGRVGITGINASINQAVAAIFPSEKMLMPFLYYYLEFSYEKNRLLGHGAHQRNLSATIIKTILVPIPTKKTQQQIVEILAPIDQKLAAEKSHKEALDTLFSSLLRDLITAKIRVNTIAV